MLKTSFFESVRSGGKTSTIRRGIHQIAAGQRIILADGFGEYAEVTITSSSFKAFQALDETDAARDGFESLEGLRLELIALYHALSDGEAMTILEFTPAR